MIAGYGNEKWHYEKVHEKRVRPPPSRWVLRTPRGDAAAGQRGRSARPAREEGIGIDTCQLVVKVSYLLVWREARLHVCGENQSASSEGAFLLNSFRC